MFSFLLYLTRFFNGVIDSSYNVTIKASASCAVLTTHIFAYLCCQCDASLDVKLAQLVVTLGVSSEGIL